MPITKIDSVNFYYEDRGRGDAGGPAIVLLHGFPLDGRIWAAQIEGLSPRHRLIAPDLRGFGRSADDQPFTMDSLADDLHNLLNSIGALPCILGGLSMGGYVAFAYQRKYPADLRGLILIDTKAEADTPQGKDGRNQMIQTARTFGSKTISDQMLPKMLTPAGLADPALAARVRQIMESCPRRTIENALAAMRDRADSTPGMAKITVPTLILVGDADVITPPAVAESMQRQIPGSKLSVIRGAGHLSSMEQPQQVTDAIANYCLRK